MVVVVSLGTTISDFVKKGPIPIQYLPDAPEINRIAFTPLETHGGLRTLLLGLGVVFGAIMLMGVASTARGLLVSRRRASMVSAENPAVGLIPPVKGENEAKESTN